jgi:hypothetical protein
MDEISALEDIVLGEAAAALAAAGSVSLACCWGLVSVGRASF